MKAKEIRKMKIYVYCKPKTKLLRREHWRQDPLQCGFQQIWNQLHLFGFIQKRQERFKVPMLAYHGDILTHAPASFPINNCNPTIFCPETAIQHRPNLCIIQIKRWKILNLQPHSSGNISERCKGFWSVKIPQALLHVVGSLFPFSVWNGQIIFVFK